MMGSVAIVLWHLRDRFRPGILFAIYLLAAGLERFLIEFLRRNEDVFLGLTQAQLISIAMMLAGGIWLLTARRRGSLHVRAEDPPPFGAGAAPTTSG
jgi:phosphatidylglycerol:prolipoprotein diacylglycerol transferase